MTRTRLENAQGANQVFLRLWSSCLHRALLYRIAVGVAIATHVGCGDDDASEDASVLDAAADGTLPDGGTEDSSVDAGDTPDYWGLAEETHQFTVDHLLTRAHSYYETVEDHTWTSEWHCASQVYADAAMVKGGRADRYESYMNNTYYFFMPKLWDTRVAEGGYFPRSAPDGRGVTREHKYVDDNGLTGVAYIEAYEATEEPIRKADYLESAENVANWLLADTPAWNEENGGYWWNTEPRSFDTGQPTQTNGLALQLFLELYIITKKPEYYERAQRIRAFLDDVLFDEVDGLYRWHTLYEDPLYFTYDQGIMIEANLLYYEIADNPSDKAVYLAAAQNLAHNMRDFLWDQKYGGFYIHTDQHTLSPVYSGWATQSLLRLYEVDGDPEWLMLARQNVDAINDTLRSQQEGLEGGYYAGGRPGASLDDINLTQQAVDQSWMQRVMALLATYYDNR